MHTHKHKNQIHTLRTSLVALLIVMTVIILDSSAIAQGTQGTLPKPITSRELESYAKRLVLSEPQKQALEPIHEEYREEFRKLRENDIQKFLDESAKMSGGMSMPKRETVEKMLKDIKRLSNKIKNLDNRFFSKVELLLDDSQLTIMPRVRLARERARYRQGAMQGIGGINNSASVDISEIYSKLDLSLDEAANTHSIIVHYEQQLTSATKDLYEAAISMMLDMIKAFEEMGLTDTDMSDPESMEKLMNAAQTVYAEVGKKFTKNTQKISRLNRKTVKKIVDIISPENARDLKQNYYRRAYPTASFDIPGSQTRFELSLRYPGLTEQQRQLITDAASDHQLAHDRITEKMVDFLEEFNKDRSMFDAFTDQNYWKDYQEKISEFQTKRHELNKSANESLDAQLGEELVAKINDPKSWTTSANAKPAKTTMRMQQFADSQELDLQESFISYGGMERPQAGPISASDLSIFAKKLELNDTQQLIIQELHQQYKEEYQKFTQKQQKEMQEAFQKLIDEQQSGDINPSGASNGYQDIYSGQQTEKLKTLGELDTAFLDDVQLLIDENSPSNALERIRLARKRLMYEQNIDSMGISFMLSMESNESHVDISSIIDEKFTDLNISSELDSILFEYEKELTSEFSKRHVLEIQSQMQSRELMREMMARREEDSDNTSMAIGMEYTLAMQKLGEDVKKANKVIAGFNRSTLDKILTIIDSSSSLQLSHAYKRACYPNIYQDLKSGQRFISAAKKMNDLSDEQRMSVNLFELEFQSQYEVLCDKMVDVYEQPSSATSQAFDDPEFMKEYMQHQQQLQVIQFDRSELNAKTRRRLRQILSPVQLERLGLQTDEKFPG